MNCPIYQLDAFTSTLFGGNPAAVMLLEEFLPDSQLLAIAAENNLSETAFLVRSTAGYKLRWFTPACEVPLCGHATLASGAVVLERLEPTLNEVAFETASGVLTVKRAKSGYQMNFPAYPVEQVSIQAGMAEALGAAPLEVWRNDRFTLVLLSDASVVRSLAPEFSLVADLDPHGVIVTASGDEGYDFISRFFAPRMGINEDPVTGSTHCVLTPYWAKRLGKSTLHAYQASQRGGVLTCTLAEDRVLLQGDAAFFFEGTAALPQATLSA